MRVYHRSIEEIYELCRRGEQLSEEEMTIDASNNTKCYEAVDFGFS